MNTRLIAIGVAVVILLGITGLVVRNQEKSPPTKNITKEDSKTSTSSLLDLLGSGKTQQCTFSMEASGTKSEGAVFISGDKMRGNFMTTTNKKTTNFYIIRTGNTNYLWGDSLPSGIKVTLSPEDLATNDQASQFINPNQNLKCGAWVAQNTQFIPPSNIQFTDYSKFIQTSTAPTTAPKTSITPKASDTSANPRCEACNFLTGDSKKVCLMRYACPLQ